LIDASGSGGSRAASDVAVDFVRFCHRRRRTGWPELYDEMCAVARRGLYHGWGFAELTEHGVEFGLAGMPRLAALVADVVCRDAARPRREVAVRVAEDTPAERVAWETPATAAVLS
jgi:hypothetical protein